MTNNKTILDIFNETASALQEKTGNLEPISAENFADTINTLPASNSTILVYDQGIILNLQNLLDNLPEDLLNAVLSDYGHISSGQLSISAICLGIITGPNYSDTNFDNYCSSMFLQINEYSNNWTVGIWTCNTYTQTQLNSISRSSTIREVLEALIDIYGEEIELNANGTPFGFTTKYQQLTSGIIGIPGGQSPDQEIYGESTFLRSDYTFTASQIRSILYRKEEKPR